jgi:hypothetical protein
MKLPFVYPPVHIRTLIRVEGGSKVFFDEPDMLTLSLLIPSITAPSSAKSGLRAENSRASRMQPAVLSRG